MDDLPEGFVLVEEKEEEELPEGFVLVEDKEESSGLIERFAEGFTTPLGELYGQESYERKAEVTPEQKEIIEKRSKSEVPLSLQVAVPGAQALADTLSGFGVNVPMKEINSAYRSLEESISGGLAKYGRAAYDMAKDEVKDVLGIDSKTKDMSFDERVKLDEQLSAAVREASPGLGIAGDVVGLGATGIGGGLRKAGLSAAQAAGVAASRAKEDKVVEALGRSLSEDVLIGLGTLGIGKVFQAVKKSPKAAEKALVEKGVNPKQAEAIAKTFSKQKQHYDDTLKSINQLDEAQAKEFEEVILSGRSIEDYPYEDLGEALDEYKTLLARKDALIQEAAEVDPRLSKRWGIKLMDAQYVGNMFDRRYGTSLMKDMNQLSRDYTQGLWAAKNLKTEGQKVFDELGINTIEDSKKLIEEVESGKLSSRSAKLSQFFEQLRQTGNDMYGEEVITKLKKGYVPQYVKPAAETAAIVEKKIKDVTGKEPSKLLSKDIESIKDNEELLSIIQYLGGFGGKKKHLLTDATLLATAKSLGNARTIRSAMDVGAKSARERLSDEVPDAIRQYDIGKLMGGWIDSVTNDAATRKVLRKIRTQGKALRAVDPMAADYVQNYVSDVAGGLKGLAAESTEFMEKFQKKNYRKAIEAEAQGDTTAAAFHRMKTRFPQYAQYLQAQLYPYLLGMRVDAVLRNLTQPYLLTIPDIGGSAKYKAELVGRSLLETAKFPFNPKALDELKSKGWMPPDPTPGAFQAMSRGIEQGGKIKRGAKKALEAANNLAMYGYQQSDVANRVITLGVGKKLTKDILNGNKSALSYVNKLPPAYKSKAKQAIAAQKPEQLRDVVTDHLIATTQFNYNRPSMSEFGRQAGTAFSMFSKWPTAIGADLFDGFDAAKFAKTRGETRLNPGVSKAMRKYMGPYVGLMAANAMITGGTGSRTVDAALGLEEERSPRREQIMGRSLPGAAPLTSITSVFSDPGQAFTPPIVDAFKDLISGNADTAFGLVPGATYARFITERLPAWAEDERGKKPTQAIKEDVLNLD